MLALHATSHGSPEEKLAWAFRMYDVDGNGSIDFNEMRRSEQKEGHGDIQMTIAMSRLS